MKPFILFFLISVAVPVLAQQDSIYGYYDMSWKKVVDTTDATYFRVVRDGPDGKHFVRDYYMSGALRFVGVSRALEPKLDIEGDGTLYYESGGIQQLGPFKDERPVGLHTYYYENGTRRKIVFHREEQKDIYHQFWSREGKPKLLKGNGLAVDDIPGRPKQFYEIRDSVMIAAFAYDEAGNTVYTMLEQHPEYPGGHAAMMSDLQGNLKYPASARRQGIDGTVYVSFVVAKNGEVVNVRVLKGIHPDCNAVAADAVSKLNKWKPGIHHGKPVSVKLVLPIKFGLTG